MPKDRLINRANAKRATATPLRRKLESMILHAVRAYTFNTPLAKGKYRAFMMALDLCKSLPEPEIVATNDGRRLWADLSTGMHEGVFFLGEYERALTELTKLLIKPGDLCLDVGANFGWYTTMFHKLVGSSGEVHAFEPVPTTFDELVRNCKLISDPPPENVHLNNFALGETTGQFKINLFAGLTTGHASLSDQGRDDATSFDCEVSTLNSYLENNGIQSVDFVKVDVEGSELSFLKGAGRLFRQEKPPFILMEMALNTTRNFGYVPDDLIKFIGSHSSYEFYKIDESGLKLVKIEGFTQNDMGANVLSLPEARAKILTKLESWF